jgi:hypothetical protein
MEQGRGSKWTSYSFAREGVSHDHFFNHVMVWVIFPLFYAKSPLETEVRF